MSDAVATSSAPAPSAPATSAAADSVSVGQRSHQPPARGHRSARETGETPARADPTAPPKRREPPAARTREKVATPETDAFKAELVARNAEADGEEPVEAKPLEGDEPTESGEAPEEEAKPEDDVSTKLAEAEKFRTEVTAKATEVLRENAGLQRKLDWLMEAVEAAGLEVDPQALELFDLRTERDLGADFTKKQAEQAEQARKADHERAVASEVTKINGEIAKAAKAAKVSESDLKARWAVSVRLWQSQGGKGDMPTLDDAVFEIQAVSNARQVKQSTSAPALVRSKGPTSAAKPRNENTHDGWRRHLRSQGFAD